MPRFSNAWRARTNVVQPEESLEAIVARVQSLVEERRASGAYPEGLEERLDEHWERARLRPRAPGVREIQDAVAAAARQSGFHVPEPASSSRIPGGAQLHEFVGKTVTRHMQELVGELQAWANAVQNAMARMASVIEPPGDHQHADLVTHVEVLYERLADLERRANVAQATAVQPVRESLPPPPPPSP